ncbi:DUF2254 domain-containing protein [Aureimonas ureilytica]|uniref:DUF2254 domain-containing protein n=1 Tax=Aureimonas ureilytica TaxID=401562 RepID=UPI0009E6D616|nr:DUF2254 domain-containing protein [Aureimonas ureilytica]
MRRWSWVLQRLRRQIWFRAAVISAAGIVTAAVSGLVGRYFPYQFPADVGQDAVGTILEILASSMLAVTTFSLTAMVTAYGSATQLATPRATQLLREDPTSQNALSTFLGAFVFSVVGIIGLQAGIYGSQGRFVLFAGTLMLILVVVLTLLRWISHITTFGRMSDVIDRLEDAAASAMERFAQAPHLGGRPAVPVPPEARALYHKRTGYVHHLDVPTLGQISTERGLVLHVAALPGTLVHPGRPVLHVEGELDEADMAALLDAFTIDRHRTFDHDPRLGLIALSEVASRALAPATNDPGTAIEVSNALLRVLLHLPAEEPDAEALRDAPSVHVARPVMEDFLRDAFDPILREGVVEVEVSLRLTKTFKALADALPHAREPVRAMARRLSERVEARQDDRDALLRFHQVHEALWDTGAERA